MTRTRLAFLMALLTLPPTAASAQAVPAPKDAYLYIIAPSDGDTVKGAFWCRFGLRNMGVTHAGDSFAGSGHHHLLVDTDEPIAPREPIPHDKNHLHYGAGETEALIELPPGKHTLQLVLSDANHFNFDPPLVSKKITIRVRSAEVSEKRNARKHHARSHRRTSREARKPDAVPEPAKPSGPIEAIGRVLGMTK